MRSILFFSLSLMFSFSALSADTACREVSSIFRKSKYFKNTGLDGKLIGHVSFESTPVGIWMSYDSGATIVAKSAPNSVVGMVRIQTIEGKCVFVVQHPIKNLLGHDVIAKDANTIEFKVDKDDKDVFFEASFMVPITDQKEIEEAGKRFNQ